MTDIKKLLEKRKAIKKKKPKYAMQDSHKLGRLKRKWKKPRGIDSKMRLNLKGYSRKAGIGYNSPKLVRGLNKDGLEIVVVNNMGELNNIDVSKQGAVIASSVGMKKKTMLIEKAREKGVKIINIDADKFLKEAESKFTARKEEKEKKKKKKTEKKKEKKKKEDKLAEKVMSEEEKAKQEKKEKDKLLTKKEGL